MSEFSLLPDKLLTEVYWDLARPWVSQVWKTIWNILWLSTWLINGPIELVKLRCKNRMENYAENLSKTDEDKLIEVIPEIGVPIINALSYTRIEELKKMYIWLLTNASTSDKVDKVHPGFISIIQSLWRDDAVLLDYINSQVRVPQIILRTHLITWWFYDTWPFMNITKILTISENDILYLNNLQWLWLIEDCKDKFIWDEKVYESLLKDVNQVIENNTDGNIKSTDVIKWYFKITEYWRKFLLAVS